MIFNVLQAAIRGANLLLQQYRPTMHQILPRLRQKHYTSLLTKIEFSNAWIPTMLLSSEKLLPRKQQELTSQPNIGNLWTKREITSSLHISRASCVTWSAFGSFSPSPLSIHLIVAKFFSTSSRAFFNTNSSIQFRKKFVQFVQSKLFKQTFSRALTSTTVLVSSAVRESLMALATSTGVLGLDGLKNENDIGRVESIRFDLDRFLSNLVFF